MENEIIVRSRTGNVLVVDITRRGTPGRDECYLFSNGQDRFAPVHAISLVKAYGFACLINMSPRVFRAGPRNLDRRDLRFKLSTRRMLRVFPVK